jgi:hypothetical protein
MNGAYLRQQQQHGDISQLVLKLHQKKLKKFFGKQKLSVLMSIAQLVWMKALMSLQTLLAVVRQWRISQKGESCEGFPFLTCHYVF